MLYLKKINNRDIIDKYKLSLFLVLLTFVVLILLLLPEMVLYDNSSNVISNETSSNIVSHKFKFINNSPKDTTSFIMKHMSPFSYSSPILDAAMNSSLDWNRSAFSIQTSVEMKRPILSNILTKDSPIRIVYNAMQSASATTFSPFTPATYGELNKEIYDVTSNLRILEETCNSPDRNYSLIEKVLDQILYLLNQKFNHLEAIHKLAADTPILQKDYEQLVEGHRSLSNDINNLGKKLENISFRSLSGKK